MFAALVAALPIAQTWDNSGFDQIGGNWGGGASNYVPSDGSTGGGDGQGDANSDFVGDSGGFSCIWSDANGCEQ